MGFFTMSEQNPQKGIRIASDRRLRLAIDDDLKVLLATERFGREWVEVGELAKRHDRAVGVVSRAITAAFREGLVEIRRVQAPTPSRVEPLERALRRKYPALRVALVVDSEGSEPDAVHEGLGRVLARDWCAASFRDDERIVVGGGRCVYHMAESLSRATPLLQMRNATVVSVGGDSYPYHEKKRNVSLDADANARLLVQAFEHSAAIGLSSHHVFLGEGSADWKDRYFSGFWSRSPSLAILGVGILDELHQLNLLTHAEAKGNFPPTNVTEALCTQIQELRLAAQRLGASESGANRPCVAELGMHLFFVPGRSTDPGAATEMHSRIDQINRQLFAPAADQLQAVGGIAIVAGGEHKASAMGYLLRQTKESGGLPIHVLCTDRSCAESLLA
jgi:hypothetical protein